MQQSTWRHHFAFDQALVRVAVLADRLEVLGDDCWMAGREHAVLAHPWIQAADVTVLDLVSAGRFVIQLHSVGAT